VNSVVIASSGRDVFFATTQGLVPSDTDGQMDVYDARHLGGFPPAPVEAEPCSGDACQGPLTNPAPLLIPGSVSQAPGENLPPPPKAGLRKKATPRRSKKASAKRKRRAKRARRARQDMQHQGGRR
jgi:hypothetical protein